jgi:hypothetical protein
MICKEPCDIVPNVPFVVGTLPTRTNPFRNTPSAVVRPVGVLVKNVKALPLLPGGTGAGAMVPLGVGLMMVVPVFQGLPERLFETDTRLVASNNDRPFCDRRFHAHAPVHITIHELAELRV